MCESGTNMKCKNCEFAIVGKTKTDEEMLKLGYKTCAKARNEIERGTFVRGDTLCLWPERLK